MIRKENEPDLAATELREIHSQTYIGGCTAECWSLTALALVGKCGSRRKENVRRSSRERQCGYVAECTVRCTRCTIIDSQLIQIKGRPYALQNLSKESDLMCRGRYVTLRLTSGM